MIFGDFLKALGQIGDPRFRGVLFKGIALTVLLLFGLYAGVGWIANWLAPDVVNLPFIGPVSWVDNLLSGASILLMMVLSVFLMVPVASAFTSIFLDDVADAVEESHYPALPPAPRVSFGDTLRDTFNFLGILIGANIGALVLYVMLPPFAPIIFWALNGLLLGREYFQLVAMRRIGRAAARQAFRDNLGTIWLAGGLMAIPLTFPLINLLIPVLGAATFTHLYHRLEGASS